MAGTAAYHIQANLLAALAHPNRIRILEFLRAGPACNCEIAPRIYLEQSNLSRHLKILVQSGVLLSWKERLRVNFKVADERVFRVLDLAKTMAKRSIETRAESFQSV